VAQSVLQLPINGILGNWLSGGSPPFRECDLSAVIRRAMQRSAPRMTSEWPTIRQEYAGRERLFYALARSRPLSHTGVLYGTYLHRSLDA
jgi:hypothetical protein